MAAVAVIGLEMDARRYRVLDVAGTEFSRSAIPNPAAHAYLPFSTTPTAAPGRSFVARNCLTASSICLRLSSAGADVCAHDRKEYRAEKANVSNPEQIAQGSRVKVDRDLAMLIRFNSNEKRG